MAHLWLLLKLRVRLALRRHSGNRFAFVGLTFLVALFGFVSYSISAMLVVHHDELSRVHSERLLDVTALIVAAFVAIGPLMGFRSNEFMDVSKLFQYAIRPTWVFVSTVFGNFISGTTLFFLPILLVPALWVAGSAAGDAKVVLVTLLYLFVLYAFVQCVTLLFLNVLRSRRWRDFLAILVPVLGMASYVGVRAIILGDRSPGEVPAIEGFLEEVDLDPWARFLPPLWYSHMVHGGADALLRGTLSLGMLAAALCVAGVSLTTRAFHGDIAITVGDGAVSDKRGVVRRILARLLPAPTAAVYAKELTVLRREPWFRMLFLQQLGLVVLICLGRGLWDQQQDPEEALRWAAIFLVFIESGFLLNTLGLEGRAIQHTAMLPANAFQILSGKNVAYFQVLAVTNLLLVPALALLSSRLAESAFPTETMTLLVTIDIVVLPVLIAAGNLLSVLLPSPVGSRGKRALGQERTGGEGCFAAVARTLFSTLAMVPAVGVGLVVATPVLFLDRGIDASFGLIWAPAGLLLSLVIWRVLTGIAAAYMQRNMPRIVTRLV